MSRSYWSLKTFGLGCAVSLCFFASRATAESHAPAKVTAAEKAKARDDHHEATEEAHGQAAANHEGSASDHGAPATEASDPHAEATQEPTTEPIVVENEVTQPFTEMPLDQLRKSIEKQHPAAYYTLAARLFTSGKKDEAVFWFYLGQLRYRYHLAVHTDLDPTGDPALFASLSEVVGAPINQYAFGNVPKLTETLDRVLAWDQKHPNGFCAKDDQVYPTIRKGLEEFREYIREHEVMIQIERKKNGLE